MNIFLPILNILIYTFLLWTILCIWVHWHRLPLTHIHMKAHQTKPAWFKWQHKVACTLSLLYQSQWFTSVNGGRWMWYTRLYKIFSLHSVTPYLVPKWQSSADIFWNTSWADLRSVVCQLTWDREVLVPKMSGAREQQKLPYQKC